MSFLIALEKRGSFIKKLLYLTVRILLIISQFISIEYNVCATADWIQLLLCFFFCIFISTFIRTGVNINGCDMNP